MGLNRQKFQAVEEKILYFQEGNKLNFQSGLGMEDPSVHKINLQPDLQLMKPVSWFLAPSCGKVLEEEEIPWWRIYPGGKVKTRGNTSLLHPQHWQFTE